MPFRRRRRHVPVPPLPRVEYQAARISSASVPKKPTSPIDFFTDVKPIFVKHCFSCHGPARSESGLRLDLRARALRGGDSGPAIVKGHSNESLLIQYVTGKNEAGIVMPPPGKAAAAGRRRDCRAAKLDRCRRRMAASARKHSRR